MHPRWRRLLLGALVAQFVVLGVIQAWSDAPTYDEYDHVPLGVTALTRHQLRFTLEHPALPYVLAAAPALFAHPSIPSGPAWHRGEPVEYPAQFMARADREGKLRRLVFLARIIPLLEGAAVGLMLFVLGRRLFGSTAGLVAAAAWFTLPLSIGMSHIDGIDIATTLSAVVCSYAFLRYVDTGDARRAAVAGAAVGLSLLTSFLAFALLAAAILLVVSCTYRAWRVATWHSLLLIVSAWATVWIGYRIISPLPNFHRVDPSPGIHSTPLAARVMRIVPWPKEFAVGFSDLLRVSTPPPAFLLGHAWTGKVWWYWPAVVIVKLPITTVLALIAGIAFAIATRVGRHALLAIGLPMLTLSFTIVVSGRQIGVRYLLPVIALGLVLAGGAIARLSRQRVVRVVVCAAAVAQLFWFAEAQPNSIAWTAPPFRPGYQYATDSNFDWGQDLYRLRDWAHRRAMFVAYFGGPGSSAGWPAAQGFGFPTQTTWHSTIVISASALTSFGRPFVGWMRAYCPVAIVGKTLLVYRFDGTPPRGPVPTTPPRPCPGGLSHAVR